VDVAVTSDSSDAMLASAAEVTGNAYLSRGSLSIFELKVHFPFL
jgi:hypothetical protein